MTGCERVLARLQQGPASHLELYALGVVAHSRISDLRKRGHRIEKTRKDDLWVYRLLDGGDRRPGTDDPAPSSSTHQAACPTLDNATCRVEACCSPRAGESTAPPVLLSWHADDLGRSRHFDPRLPLRQLQLDGCAV